jgi:ribonucleotide reductase beta subunit family protein with ferritin-like domain
MKGSVKMINLINADRALKQLYLAMIEEEFIKANEQSKTDTKEDEEEENETSVVI